MFKRHTVSIDHMSILCEIGREYIKKIILHMSHYSRSKIHCDRSSSCSDVRHDDLITCRTATRYDIRSVQRYIRVAFYIALSYYRSGKIVIVFERQVMDEPCTKSQQESKQKNCKISPADIQ